MKTRLSTTLQQFAVTVFTVAMLFLAYTAWAASDNVSSAAGNTPAFIPYQGTLSNSAGQPINGNVNLTFKLYNVQSGGTALWTETHTSVPIDNGLFQVKLGSVAAIPDNLWTNGSLYLGTQVGSDPEMSPREQLGTVPYAKLANTALTVPNGSITQVQAPSLLKGGSNGIVKWGSAVITTRSNGDGTIVFNEPFPTKVETVIAVNGDSRYYHFVVEITDDVIPLGGFNFSTRNAQLAGGTQIRVNYIAIGY